MPVFVCGPEMLAALVKQNKKFITSSLIRCLVKSKGLLKLQKMGVRRDRLIEGVTNEYELQLDFYIFHGKVLS